MKKHAISAVDGTMTKWLPPVALAVVLLISFLAFLPVPGNSFIWDDKLYILNNKLIRNLSWENLLAIFSNFSSDNYTPVTDLFKAILYAFNGSDPLVFHLGSLVIHLVNVALAFWFLRLLSGRWEAAAVAALLWGIHPLNVESVAWASGISNLLCASFFLGSLVAYLKFLDGTKKRLLFLSVVFFLLAILSKAVAVVLPVVLLLIDSYKGRKLTVKTVLEKLPFWILALAAGVLTLWLKSRVGSIENAASYTFFERIIFASYAYLAYLFKTILPVRLSAFYPYPALSGQSLPVIYYASLFLLAGFGVFTAFILRRSRIVFFGVLFFSVNIALLLQLIPIGRVIMADRYGYLPSIGIFYLAGEAAYFLWHSGRRYTAIFLAAALALFFAVTTWQRSGVWRNEFTLWSDVIEKYDDVEIAYNNRGNYLLKQQRFEEALQDFDRVVALSPGVAVAHFNRGNVLFDMKRYGEAAGDYSRAIQLDPGFYLAYYNRGLALYENGDRAAACADFQQASALGYRQAGEAMEHMCR